MTININQSKQANQEELTNMAKFIEAEFGFKLRIVHQHEASPTIMESELPEGNTMPNIFKKINARVLFYKSSAKITYQYTHPDGGTNGYTLGYVKTTDTGYIYEPNIAYEG